MPSTEARRPRSHPAATPCTPRRSCCPTPPQAARCASNARSRQTSARFSAASRRPRRSGCRGLPLAPARLLGRRARRAEVVHVVRILHQALVEVVAHPAAGRADEVNALAVEDATLQLLDPDAEQLLVLPLDLPPPGLVLRELLLALVGGMVFLVEDAEALRLATALLGLPRACHSVLLLLQRVRCMYPQFFSHTQK